MTVSYLDTRDSCWTSATAHSVSDLDLVAGARVGDEQAWELIVQRYQPMILRIAWRHRLHDCDAHDVSQYVWTRLVENSHRLREPRALPGWIATTATRACLEVLRLRQRSTTVDPTADEGLDKPERFGGRPSEVVAGDLDAAMLADERRAAVRAGMAELDGRQRELLLMLVADPPVPYAEISERMGVPMGSIGPTRARLLKKLRTTQAVRLLLEDVAVAA